MEEVRNNLDTYKTLFLVAGILNFLGVLFFIGYMLFGLFLSFKVNDIDNEFPTYIFIIVGGIGAFLCLIVGVLNLMTSKYLRARKNHKFILVMAIVNCCCGILHLILGIFTLVEITKPEIKALFKEKS